jgi:hypothetical protein
MLLAGACLLHGCQPFSPFSSDARVVNLPELCKLSIDELLRVTVIDDSKRHLPLMPLIDLPLEELLMIEAVRRSHGFGQGGALATSNRAMMD